MTTPIWKADKACLFKLRKMRYANLALHSIFLVSAINVNLNMDEQRIDEWSLMGGCDNIRDNLLNFNFSAAIPKISFSSFFPLLYLDQLLISYSRLLDWF